MIMSKYNISENTKKRRIIPLTQRTPILLLGLLIFGFLSKATWNAYLEKEQSKKTAISAKTELKELEERQIFVSEALTKLSTEAGREAEFRQKFGVGRRGEQVAIIVEATNKEASSGVHDFWQRVKNFFNVLFQK